MRRYDMNRRSTRRLKKMDEFVDATRDEFRWVMVDEDTLKSFGVLNDNEAGRYRFPCESQIPYQVLDELPKKVESLDDSRVSWLPGSVLGILYSEVVDHGPVPTTARELMHACIEKILSPPEQPDEVDSSDGEGSQHSQEEGSGG